MWVFWRGLGWDAVRNEYVVCGIELSLLCDMRVAESAVFGVFCRRFGESWMATGRGCVGVLEGVGVGCCEGVNTCRPANFEKQKFVNI